MYLHFTRILDIQVCFASRISSLWASFKRTSYSSKPAFFLINANTVSTIQDIGVRVCVCVCQCVCVCVCVCCVYVCISVVNL